MNADQVWIQIRLHCEPHESLARLRSGLKRAFFGAMADPHMVENECQLNGQRVLNEVYKPAQSETSQNNPERYTHTRITTVCCVAHS